MGGAGGARESGGRSSDGGVSSGGASGNGAGGATGGNTSGTGGGVDHDAGREAGAGRDSGANACAKRPFTIEDGVDCTVSPSCPAGSTCDSACVPSHCQCSGSSWDCTTDCRHACTQFGRPLLREPASLSAAMTDYVWLIGWSGDQDHYSWVRFTPSADPDQGTWAALDTTCATCVGSFLNCAGTNGSYTVTPGEDAGLSSLFMRFPPTCGGNGPADNPSMTATTGAFLSPESLPPGARWQLPLTQQSASVSAFGYPLTQCNPDFTQCDPLTP